MKPDTPPRVFPRFGGSGSDTEGLGVEASVGADATWKLRFRMPPALPSGTGKLVLDLLVNATSGNAKVNPKWASVAVSGEDIDAKTLNAEGVQTIAAPATANQTVQTKVTLDADTLVADEIVVMDLVFETASWTLAAVSTWLAYIVWE
jgi:hypothetical protein